MGMNRKKTEEYIKNQYGIEPDFPWDGDFVTAVFRHKDNRKWFALIMRVSGYRLGLDTDEPVDCMNLKIDDPAISGDKYRIRVHVEVVANKNYILFVKHFCNILSSLSLSPQEYLDYFRIEMPVNVYNPFHF